MLTIYLGDETEFTALAPLPARCRSKDPWIVAEEATGRVIGQISASG